MKLLVEMINNECEVATNGRDEAVRTIEREITRYKRMDDMMYEDKLSGEISADKYRDKHQEFMQRISDLQKQMNGYDDNIEATRDNVITTIELSQQAGKLYDEIEDIDEKRNIITKMFDSMVVNDDSVSVIYTDFVKLIAQMSAEMSKIMATPEFKNLINKKDLFTRGETSLFEQNKLMSSIWCRRGKIFYTSLA